ncbi:hypothetical protein C483_01946 [Natrialba hulunbeirensis JCM 10989]|uniref:Uncharacterized protein n=1 Tax=Natrialba hulunbeirensis JCM 10989 TaxID=1227493 RepID=M0AB45_9EURY|nr:MULTISPECIES: hypothetical protein [Natrialba]ELY95087.1 hypothetical protein C483_01946 [Natrialba hulunbeirensis JCM 10989]
MYDLLFSFEKERLPPAVILATGALIAVFVLGLLYRGVAFALF